MKQLIIIIFFVLTLFAKAFDEDRELLRRGSRSTTEVCINFGKGTGKQTLEVPKEHVPWFLAERRTSPAKRGACKVNRKKTVKTLKKRETRSKLFCRRIRGWVM
jgi:hypothetical protein